MKSQTLTTLEVARFLKRPVAHVTHMVRQGLLTPCRVDGKKYFFDREQVEAYKQLKDQGLSTARVAGWAIQTRAAVSALQRRLDDVYEILGLDIAELDRTATGVSRLYEAAKRRGDVERDATPQEIAEWARILHSIDAPYLGLVSHVMVDQEPWRVFMRVADAVKTGVARIQLTADPTLERSFRALLHARNQLRAVAYFYAQPRMGRQELRLAFTGEAVDQEVLGLIKQAK